MTKDLDISVYRDIGTDNLEQFVYLAATEPYDPATARELLKIRQVLAERNGA